MLTRTLQISLSSLCLMSLPACSLMPEPEVVTQVELIPLEVPASLQIDCDRHRPDEPEASGADIGDLVASRSAWRKAFERCDADHAALIEALG